MNPELQQTLTALANKLGTSVERLWPMLVSKERFEAILGMVIGFGGAAALAWLVCYIWPRYDELYDKFPVLTVASFSIIMGLIFVMVAICSIPQAVFPEASAIQSLLGR